MARHELTRAFAGGPIFEFVDPAYHGLWYNNVASCSTFSFLMDLLPSCPGSRFGPDPDNRGVIVGGYKNAGASSAEYGGDRVDWNYTEEGGWNQFEWYISEAHNGMIFTRGQVNRMGPKAGSRVDIIEQEKREKLSQLMVFDNNRLLGVNGQGTGAFLGARGTYDTWGLRTILNNANAYYNIARPGTGELNSINLNAVAIAANQALATFDGWQQLVANNEEQVPTLVICTTRLRQWLQAEGITPWANVNRAVRFNLNESGEYSYKGPDWSTWGNDYVFLLDSAMPGGGDGFANNEFLMINPNYLDFMWEDGLFYNVPEWNKGGQLRPNQGWGNIESNIEFMLRNPRAHVRVTNVTIPAV